MGKNRSVRAYEASDLILGVDDAVGGLSVELWREISRFDRRRVVDCLASSGLVLRSVAKKKHDIT